MKAHEKVEMDILRNRIRKLEKTLGLFVSPSRTLSDRDGTMVGWDRGTMEAQARCEVARAVLLEGYHD